MEEVAFGEVYMGAGTVCTLMLEITEVHSVADTQLAKLVATKLIMCRLTNCPLICSFSYIQVTKLIKLLLEQQGKLERTEYV